MSDQNRVEHLGSHDLRPSLRDDVSQVSGGEGLKRCFQCGSCSGGCPVRELDERYNPRKIIRMVLLGLRDRVFSSDFIWLCSSCYTCQQRCPQDVKITDVIRAIRNLAVKEGYAHPSYLRQAEAIVQNGRLYVVDEIENDERSQLGLPVISRCGEISKLLDSTWLGCFLRDRRT